MMNENADKRRLCLQLSKAVFGFSNVIIGLFAILLIAFGATAMNSLSELASLYKVTIPAGIIVLGVFMLLLPVLGFVGMLKNHKKVIIAYTVILLIFIICEFGVGGGAYTMREEIPTTLRTTWDALPAPDRGNIEAKFSCCGWVDPSDYPGTYCVANYPVNNSTNSTVNGTSNDGGMNGVRSFDAYEENAAHQEEPQMTNPTPGQMEGCGQKLTEQFQSSLSVVGAVAITFATLQLVGLVFGFVIFGYIKSEDR